MGAHKELVSLNDSTDLNFDFTGSNTMISDGQLLKRNGDHISGIWESSLKTNKNASFTSADNKAVTVVNGLITGIV